MSSTLAALLKQSYEREKRLRDIPFDTRGGGTHQHADAHQSLAFWKATLSLKRTVWISHTEVHEWMLEKSARGVLGLLTILREPIARSRSLYEYFRRAGQEGDPTVPYATCYNVR